MTREIDRDRALLWLNDYCGHEVEVVIHAGFGDNSAMIAAARGVLRHWHAEGRDSVGDATPPPTDELAGAYNIGQISINVSHMPGARELREDPAQVRPDGLAFEIADGVSMSIEWCEEFRGYGRPFVGGDT